MKDRYINRELSWLEFNQRVLDEARNDQLPLLERLKFLAITASNLDEFFMVRYGGLLTLARRGSRKREVAGLTASEQIKAISARTRTMVADQYCCFGRELEPALAEAGIRRLSATELTNEQLTWLEATLVDEAISVLAPIAVSEDEGFPHVANQSLYLFVRIQLPTDDAQVLTPPPAVQSENGTTAGQGGAGGESVEATERYAIIPIGDAIARIVRLDKEGEFRYILIEDLVAHFAHRFFPGQTILECAAFRISRNADMSVRDDAAADLMRDMTDILDARKESPCVRLELASSASSSARSHLIERLAIEEDQVFDAEGPIDLSVFFRLADMQGFDELKYEAWPPQACPDIDPTVPMFDTLAERDVLLCHPFESFEPVVRFLEEAASDPDVLAIKQILYRTSRNSPIVDALRLAAENGKNVTALIELKARFDEARNIAWARQLEQAGVHVIYGVKGLKTHAKICVVVRREPHGIQRYVHFGTGNYNEATARLYGDVSLMTRHEDLGGEAISFFNAISGFSQPQHMRKLAAAPINLRDRLLDLIEVEKQNARSGHRGQIVAKFNSLVDPVLIDALYDASKEGVKIQLNIRGICCLRPGVEGLSENIQVISIVDRFLEHARIAMFHHGGDQRLFISSADWMPRNLDRRVELLVPVEDEKCGRKLTDILMSYFEDNAKARELMPDGSYRLPAGKNRPSVRSQEKLYAEACAAMRRASESRLTEFEPHHGSGTVDR